MVTHAFSQPCADVCVTIRANRFTCHLITVETQLWVRLVSYLADLHPHLVHVYARAAGAARMLAAVRVFYATQKFEPVLFQARVSRHANGDRLKGGK